MVKSESSVCFTTCIVNFQSNRGSYYHDNDEVVPVPCTVLCSLVRMGHKYAILKVLNDALSRLKRYYTSDLSIWSDRSRRAEYVSVSFNDYLQAIEVAYLTNTSSILPSAYLDMANLVDTDILKLSDCDGQYQCGLTPKLVQRVVVEKAAIIANMTSRMISLHTAVPALECLTADHCVMIAHQALRLRGLWHVLFYLHLQPLYQWHWLSHEHQLCPSCQDASGAKDLELLKL